MRPRSRSRASCCPTSTSHDATAAPIRAGRSGPARGFRFFRADRVSRRPGRGPMDRRRSFHVSSLFGLRCWPACAAAAVPFASAADVSPSRGPSPLAGGYGTCGRAGPCTVPAGAASAKIAAARVRRLAGLRVRSTASDRYRKAPRPGRAAPRRRRPLPRGPLLAAVPGLPLVRIGTRACGSGRSSPTSSEGCLVSKVRVGPQATRKHAEYASIRTTS